MKAVIVVAPAYLRDLGEDDGSVEVVLPRATEDAREKMRQQLKALLADEGPDVLTISFPGSPSVQIVAAEKVKAIVST